MSKILVTAALPYANGPIHIGHLVEYMQADIFVRALRLMGRDVIYCCADDAHGTPIEITSKKMGILPEELINKFHKEHLQDFNDFHISFDSYYSTNSEENKHYSDLIFSRLKEKGLIYKKKIELTYCENCKRFLPDRYVRGKCPKCKADDQYGDVCEYCNATYSTVDLKQPYCVICGSKPVRKIAEHYFFKLSKLSDKLKKWLKNKSLQKEIVNFVKNWIKEGLQDWCISRNSPYFGFKIPGEKDLYYYVWLDAPIGYIASTANYCKKHGLNVEDYWVNKNAQIIHFIGKDITYFHFLFWPAMLMESDFNLPSNIIVHGFLTINKEKMSKSRGTFITARQYLSLLNPEYLRFYYAANLTRKMSDLDLDLKDFKDKINNELIANIANFCYRVLSFVNNNLDSKISSIDDSLAKNIENRFKKIERNYLDCDFRQAVKEIMEISAIGNKYFQENAPWKMIKNDKEKTQNILGFSVNLIKNIAILLKPIIPVFSSELEKQLNLKNLSWNDLNFKLSNHKINRASILIKKIEDEADRLIVKEFPLDLRVGVIKGVENIRNSDIYLLKVDVSGIKKLVAGLKGHYSNKELIGKKIIVVNNLEPKKIKGVWSEAMLLAASDEKKVGLLTVKKAGAGSLVRASNLPSSTKIISFKEFQKLNLNAREGKAFFEEHQLNVDGEEVIVEKVKEGKIV